MNQHSPSSNTDRRAWMATLAKADWPALKAFWHGEETAPEFELLRRPETGLVMLRGRMGGSGAAFNFGEATVTRCSVRLADGTTGHAYITGRNREHAKVAALYDALLQQPEHRERVLETVIAPLDKVRCEKRQKAASKAAATKVEFFTMVRGED